MNPRTLTSVVAAAVTSVLVLAGCAAPSAPVAGASPSSSAAGWSYTDDIGNTVTLAQRPARIAGFTDQALSLFSYGIAPVAVFGRTDVATDTRFGGFDTSAMKIVGNSYGEINLEALAQAKPDLIVTGSTRPTGRGRSTPPSPTTASRIGSSRRSSPRSRRS